MDILKPHTYIAEQKALYYKTLNETITEGEIVLQYDFAENYTFVEQDAVQSNHWNNEPATFNVIILLQRFKCNKIRNYHYAVRSQTWNCLVLGSSKNTTPVFLNKALPVTKIIYITVGAQ